jgi:hypothetical protein
MRQGGSQFLPGRRGGRRHIRDPATSVGEIADRTGLRQSYVSESIAQLRRQGGELLMLFMFLLNRLGGKSMLGGVLLTACGIALVAIWALAGVGHGTALLARFGILCTLSGAFLVVRTAYRGRHEPQATSPDDQKANANRR